MWAGKTSSYQENRGFSILLYIMAAWEKLLENPCRSRDLLGQRCGLGTSISIGISSNSPGGSRAATAENLSMRDINSEVSLNPGECLGGLWVQGPCLPDCIS